MSDVKKTTRVGIVGSVVWLLIAYFISWGPHAYTPFDTKTFLLLGIFPLVAFWGWKYIKAAND